MLELVVVLGAAVAAKWTILHCELMWQVRVAFILELLFVGALIASAQVFLLLHVASFVTDGSNLTRGAGEKHTATTAEIASENNLIRGDFGEPMMLVLKKGGARLCCSFLLE